MTHKIQFLFKKSRPCFLILLLAKAHNSLGNIFLSIDSRDINFFMANTCTSVFSASCRFFMPCNLLTCSLSSVPFFDDWWSLPNHDRSVRVSFDGGCENTTAVQVKSQFKLSIHILGQSGLMKEDLFGKSHQFSSIWRGIFWFCSARGIHYTNRDWESWRS